MPFIAIAAAIILVLGGGVTVAADHAHQGDALYSYKVNVNDNVRHEYHVLRASMGAEATTTVSSDAEVSGNSMDSASTSNGVMLRVREDASDEAKAADDKAEGNGAVNADGSVKVNIH